MVVLVGFESAQGSTQGIAQRIAERLRSRGFDVQLEKISSLSKDTTFDAAIFGSAIHSGSWLPEASRTMAEQSNNFGGRPVWLYSVSSIGETSSFFPRFIAGPMRRMRGETKEIAAWRRQFSVRGHRNFAGKVEKGDWGRAGEVFLRGLGGHYGDSRDWRDIDAWADQIAATLQPAS